MPRIRAAFRTAQGLPVGGPALQGVLVASLALAAGDLLGVGRVLLGLPERLDHVEPALFLVLGVLRGFTLCAGKGAVVMGSEHEGTG